MNEFAEKGGGEGGREGGREGVNGGRAFRGDGPVGVFFPAGLPMNE